MLSKETLGPILAAVMAIFTAQCNEGCLPATEASSEYKRAILNCVQKATTREESEACRKAVNEEYGLCKGNYRPKAILCP